MVSKSLKVVLGAFLFFLLPINRSEGLCAGSMSHMRAGNNAMVVFVKDLTGPRRVVRILVNGACVMSMLFLSPMTTVACGIPECVS